MGFFLSSFSIRPVRLLTQCLTQSCKQCQFLNPAFTKEGKKNNHKPAGGEGRHRLPCLEDNSNKETLLMSSEQVTSLTASLSSRTLQIKQGTGLLSRSRSPPLPKLNYSPSVYLRFIRLLLGVSLHVRTRQQPPGTPLPHPMTNTSAPTDTRIKR